MNTSRWILVEFKFLNEYILLLFDPVEILVDENEILDDEKKYNVILFKILYWEDWLCGFHAFYWARKVALKSGLKFGEINIAEFSGLIGPVKQQIGQQ